MPYQPTLKQKEAAAERRRVFQTFVSKLAAMTETERIAQMDSRGAIVATVEGKPLSPTNTLLLLMQFEHVTIVGGFRQWLGAGRCVKKGEHGLSIWVPATHKQDGKEVATKTGDERQMFFLGTVFDISQTEVSHASQS